MEKVSIVIPVHNLVRRGLKRIRNLVLSIQLQMDYVDEIIIVNSSEKPQFDMLNGLLQGFDVNHISMPLYEFNKPKLLNRGIKESKAKYVFCTDADYIFKSDLLYICSQYRNEKRMLHKEVKMLPNLNITDQKVKDWNFPICGFNKWGKIANGAMQYATRDFFIANPYPEEMSGFSSMDNIMTYMAYNNGLEIQWIVESDILHQKHPVENKMGGALRKQFDDNQTMLQAYINKYNLPCLLTK